MNAPQRRIIMIASGDPYDMQAFSGTLFHMMKALQHEFPQMEVVRSWRPRFFYRLQRIMLRLSGGRSDPYYWNWLTALSARRLLAQWRDGRPLVISAVNSSLTAMIADHVPTIHISDATFRAMRTLYPSFAQLGPAAAKRGDRIEADTILKSVHASYSSGWAARSAVEDYGMDPAKVSEISWGCNFEFIEKMAEQAQGDVCKLLFVGVDWERKGGDIVLETAALLSRRGFPFTLDIVGADPPAGVALPENTIVHGLLRKSDPADQARLRALFAQASFLFLPTRQDCTPMVFAEANAYGAPALTRDVGGVAGVVKDGVNGIVLPGNASVADFADTIARIWKDRPLYAELRKQSRAEYEGRLNWAVWARHMRAIIERLPN